MATLSTRFLYLNLVAVLMGLTVIVPGVGKGAPVQTTSTIRMIGFDVSQTDIVSKKSLGCREHMTCVPIAEANSYQISRPVNPCEDLIGGSAQSFTSEVLRAAKEIQPKVETIGMPTTQGINVLSSIDPEFVREHRFQPFTLLRKKGQSPEEHLFEIHRLLKKILLRGFAPVIGIWFISGIKEDGNHVNWHRHGGHALTLTSIQEDIAPDGQSFLIEVLDPDNGKIQRLTIGSTRRTKLFHAGAIRGFDANNCPIGSFSGHIDRPSCYAVVTGHEGFSQAPRWQRGLTLLTLGFGSFRPSQP